MPHVFRFGPILLENQPDQHMYVALDDEGTEVLSSPMSDRAEVALAQVAAEVALPLTCDAELAEAGRALGFTAGEGPDGLAAWRQGMPLSFAYAPWIAEPEVEPLIAFARAGAAVDAARVALQAVRGRPFEVKVTGAVEVERIGIFHGNELEGGITLVQDRPTFDRLERLILAGLGEEVSTLTRLIATFELEPPEYVKPTLTDLGARGLMLPRHMTSEGPMELTAEHLWVLTAAMHALAALEGLECRTHLELPSGDAVDISLRFLEWDVTIPRPIARA
jgi:hypothetical protein